MNFLCTIYVCNIPWHILRVFRGVNNTLWGKTICHLDQPFKVHEIMQGLHITEQYLETLQLSIFTHYRTELWQITIEYIGTLHNSTLTQYNSILSHYITVHWDITVEYIGTLQNSTLRHYIRVYWHITEQYFETLQ